MNTQSTSGTYRSGGTLNTLQRIWHILRDPNVPSFWKWFLPLGALVYWISPIDLIPFVPIDDIAVVFIAMSIFLQMFGRHTPNAGSSGFSQQRSASGGDEKTIDTTWRVIDET